MEENKKIKRGLAAASPETRKRVSSLGGKAARETGRSHRWSKEEAKEAGRKGGSALSKKRNGEGWHKKKEFDYELIRQINEEGL